MKMEHALAVGLLADMGRTQRALDALTEHRIILALRFGADFPEQARKRADAMEAPDAR